MKIAVTYENGNIFQHFGHCESFKIYEVEDGAVKSRQVVSAVGSGHGALAGFLSENGIRLYPGAAGNADDSVNALLSGKLVYNPDVECAHHHDGEHSCGEHHCSTDKHGCPGNH